MSERDGGPVRGLLRSPDWGIVGPSASTDGAFARLVTHYFSHGAWLEEGAVIRDAGRLAGIPGVMVQGGLDLGNLVGTPWLLAQAWPGSELVTIDSGGHGSGPGMTDALVVATDRFATRR